MTTDSPEQTDMPHEAEQGFDALLSTLEDIVAQLEKGDLPLEEALGRFEKGVSIVERASNVLKTAEMRVDTLIRHQDGFQVEPLDDGP